MNSLFLHITVNKLSDVTIGLLYGDFIFEVELAILYATKVVASFYKVQYKHNIKLSEVGCAHCVCVK